MQVYFRITCKLGKVIRTTKPYWEMIVSVKHPIMEGKKNQVKDALSDPDEIRRSKKDKKVHMYYKRRGKHLVCVVCKHLNKEGFIITTYLTDKIKEGVVVWKK